MLKYSDAKYIFVEYVDEITLGNYIPNKGEIIFSKSDNSIHVWNGNEYVKYSTTVPVDDGQYHESLYKIIYNKYNHDRNKF